MEIHSKSVMHERAAIEPALVSEQAQLLVQTWSAGLSVTGDGTGVVAHAGSVGLHPLADRIGLTGGVSRALARFSFAPRDDRGWSR